MVAPHKTKESPELHYISYKYYSTTYSDVKHDMWFIKKIQTSENLNFSIYKIDHFSI